MVNLISFCVISKFIWVLIHLHHHSPSDHMIQRAVIKLLLRLEVEELFVGADGLQQLDDVVGVKRAGLRGHLTGQIREADVRHALHNKPAAHVRFPAPSPHAEEQTHRYLMDVKLPRFDGLDVSPGLRRQIHHHRPVLHALHHLTLYQHWSSFT